MFADDYKAQPYWWDTAPLCEEGKNIALPPQVDVLVIGAGYTGLHAALQTARAGRQTLVIDARQLGWGASTRNGGQVSTSLKPSLPALVKKYGDDLAHALYREGQASLDYTAAFVRNEAIDCGFERVGRFHAAHNATQYDKLARAIDHVIPGLGTEAFMVPRGEQRAELGTDHYFGGAVFPHHAALDPGYYHRGLLARVRTAGAVVLSSCAAKKITRERKGFTVQTVRGVVGADQVVVATNGYTGPLTPRLRRRVIPIGSYVIATEPLAPEVMARVMPKNRIVSDTRRVVYYYRPSPDRSRIVFGGRVSLAESNPQLTAPRLHAALVQIFPELAEVKVTHSWGGTVAFTFDRLMHTGEEDGLHYAMGYCGSGVGMAGYLGMKVGRRVLGQADGETALSRVPFQTRPFYWGRPWFLAPSVLVYRTIDSLNI